MPYPYHWQDDASPLEEARIAAADIVGERNAAYMTVIYTRELPHTLNYQNGLVWYPHETVPDQGEFHRIRTNLVETYFALLYTLESEHAGWYLVHTLSGHDYIVYCSPNNPEYTPLRANPPQLLQ